MRTESAAKRFACHQSGAANVLGVRVDALDMEGALERIANMLRLGQKGYVCAVDVNGVLAARRDGRVAKAFADAFLAAPDGTPMVWVGRLQGQREIRYVRGPDLMREILSRPEFSAWSHFFYGGNEGVAQQLAATWVRRFPGTRIAGTWTPPFRDLTADEEAGLVRRLRLCKPDIIWIGIGAPRQELFMHRLIPHLDQGLIFGVGAAFDFHTGRIRDCAPWVKRMGFHWLHRLMQDPRRLWRRNLRNATFLWHIALQLTGLKKYPPTLTDPRERESVTVGHPAERTSLHPAPAGSSSSVVESA